jgi:glycosyltransferase involved in cell wall biosynthesis
MNISVVIPTFNEESLIEKCLESLQKQTEKPFEIIVVDNNSTDKTATIAKKMGARVIAEKTQGISFARNAGFNAAKGEIIARLDADTTALPNWIERIKKDIEIDGKDAVFGPAYYLDLPAKLQFSHLPSVYFFKLTKAILKKHMLFGLNMALKKSLWEKVKKEVCMDNEVIHEDFDLAIHLWKYGNIEFDKDLRVKTSPRRWKNVHSDIEYTQKLFVMLKSHGILHLPTLEF